MVTAVRRGQAMRAVARRFGVAHSTVLFWVHRAHGRRLDRVDWGDRPDGPRAPPNRTPRRVERAILRVRRELRVSSALGEYGRGAIQRALAFEGVEPPSVRTIDRILERNGAFDGRRRQRWPAPPRGWYLPDLAAGRVELDSFDLIVELKIQDGPLVDVLTGISHHGGLPMARPVTRAPATFVEQALVDHWREIGLPCYSQFDNDTRFQGAHHVPDVLGRVLRRCLSLGVTPVFAPPRETGFQAAIESFNGRWERAVWYRFHHANLAGLRRRSDQFLGAIRDRHALRIDAAPAREPFPRGSLQSLDDALRGHVIFLRRTDAAGRAQLLGRVFPVRRNWCHRLVRADVDLDQDRIRFFALRRREPEHQPILREIRYLFPRRPFGA